MVGQLHVPVVDSSPLSVGSTEITTSLAHIVCDGLMALPFFVIGLEVRREFSRGELTDRRRVVIPMVSGLVGMLIPALIFLAVNG